MKVANTIFLLTEQDLIAWDTILLQIRDNNFLKNSEILPILCKLRAEHQVFLQKYNIPKTH